MLTLTNRKTVLDNNAIITAKQKQQVGDFSAGYIDELDANMLPANALFECENVKFGLKGSVETRMGLDNILTTVPGNYRIRNVTFFNTETGTPAFLASYNDTIGKYNTSTKSFDDIITGLSSTTNVVDWFTYKNKFYVMSDDDFKVYDGTTAWNAGLTKPSTTCTAAMAVTSPKDSPTVVAGASTGITGTFLYKVTYVTATGESESGPPSTSLTVSDKKIDLSNIPIGPSGVTARKIYRTKAYGIVFYLVTTIADNTTTSYTDSTADTSLGAAIDTPLNNLDGKYTYKVSFVYGERGESEPSITSNEIEVRNGRASLTDIPIGGTGVTKRKIYRTTGDGVDDTQRLLATIDDNTTTTYDDNKLDADLGTVVDVSANIPPKFTFGLFKKQSATLWAVDAVNYPNRIYLSKPLYPEVVPDEYWLNLPNTGDTITGLAEYYGDVYVFMKRKIYKITGESIDTVAVSVVSESAGCIARNTIQHARQELIFLSYDGLFTLSRVLLSSNANTIDVKPLSVNVGKSFEDINWDYAYKATSYVYQDCYGIAFPKGTATENNICFEMTLDGKAWAKQTGKYGYAASFAVGNVEGAAELFLYIGTSAQDGKIYKYPGTSYSDDGVAINSYFITKIFDGDVPESIKRWKSIFVETEATGDWDLYLWYRKSPYEELDFGWIEKLLPLDPAFVSGTGSMPLFSSYLQFYPINQFALSATSYHAVSVKTIGKGLSGQSNYIQFKIGNNGNFNEHFKIYKIMLYFRVKKPRV